MERRKGEVIVIWSGKAVFHQRSEEGRGTNYAAMRARGIKAKATISTMDLRKWMCLHQV